jgi:hypothetical protein
MNIENIAKENNISVDEAQFCRDNKITCISLQAGFDGCVVRVDIDEKKKIEFFYEYEKENGEKTGKLPTFSQLLPTLCLELELLSIHIKDETQFEFCQLELIDRIQMLQNYFHVATENHPIVEHCGKEGKKLIEEAQGAIYKVYSHYALLEYHKRKK